MRFCHAALLLCAWLGPSQGLASEGWFESIRVDEASCADTPRERPSDQVIQVQLFLDSELDQRASLVAHSQRAAGLLSEYGIQLKLLMQPESLSPAPRFTMTREELTRHGKLGVQKALTPFSDFVVQHGQPTQEGTIQVVISSTLSAPESAAESLFDELVAFTFSPALIGAVAETGEPDLGMLLGSKSFTPVVLLSAEELLRHRPGYLDLTLAHEIGHALGLPHETRQRKNLMHRGRWWSCLGVLEPAQLDRTTLPEAASP